ncbi:MAG: glycoside hydrolase family 2 [Bacteroidetes bacterium]|nr:MAG: glycoside hydrolase family 2 [Bacteroidota bacterium]
MKKSISLILVIVLSLRVAQSQEPRKVINLNGIWDFDQTANAFPPEKFTRKIPVPGLVHLAEPKIVDYDKFFNRPDKPEAKEQFNLYNLDYTPRYSWYKKKIFIPKELENKEGLITIKKSQYVTQVYINGMDMGTSMACYTPIEFPVNKAIKFGADNEILIRVGERIWLPVEAAGGTDKEKEHYLPGIWDDVLLSFTGNIRLNRLLILPSVTDKKLTIKTQVRSLIPAQIFYGDPMADSVKLEVVITEKITGKVIANAQQEFTAKRDNLTEMTLEIPLSGVTLWTPEKPFLYNATARVKIGKVVSDELSHQFGMRDFTRKGKFFYLNGEKYFLRGTNITLQRFFEDPDCGNLVWDKEWVKKLLVNYPKQLNWNAMRICVGIVPDFWYDIADEYGLLLQNEWLYWQNHGWDDQIRKEYTDWVWTDGNHPGIAIWDAINENTDMFIGNTLIPELKKLDPTRIWDAGYMREEVMKTDEMDEPHPYQAPIISDGNGSDKTSYPLGNLDFKPQALKMIQEASVPQLANEYGWIWLWRNGLPSKLTVDVYNYYLGTNSTPLQNREFQAYFLQLETEWLRSESNLAGVLAFCYLTNNYGYTGDWFIDNIKDLKPAPALEWFSNAFAPSAVFINLSDERYVKQVNPHQPGEKLSFKLAKINDADMEVTGKVTLKIFDNEGIIVAKKTLPVTLSSFDRSFFPVEISLPREPGGYLLTAEFIADGSSGSVISRRFLKVGIVPDYKYFKMQPVKLK